MLSEVVVATSSTDSFIYIWDIRSGTLLTTIKGNKTDTHALSLLSPLYQPARKAYIYSAQNDRPQINVWSFRKVTIFFSTKLINLKFGNFKMNLEIIIDNFKDFIHIYIRFIYQ